MSKRKNESYPEYLDRLRLYYFEQNKGHIRHKTFTDESGNKYGKLTVISKTDNHQYKRGDAYFLCKCDCGNLIEACGAALRRGKKKSCGCLYIETRRVKRSIEVKRKLSEARKGMRFTEEHKRNLSNAHAGFKVKIETKRKISAFKQGIPIEEWKEYSTTKTHRLKSSFLWKRWRDDIFSRDSWTCQNCGEKGGCLHPHHIKPKHAFPELIFDIDNGITLCKSCHMKTESWGRTSGNI